MMTEACGATNCTMMEVGEAINYVCGNRCDGIFHDQAKITT